MSIKQLIKVNQNTRWPWKSLTSVRFASMGALWYMSLCSRLIIRGSLVQAHPVRICPSRSEGLHMWAQNNLLKSIKIHGGHEKAWILFVFASMGALWYMSLCSRLIIRGSVVHAFLVHMPPPPPNKHFYPQLSFLSQGLFRALFRFMS